MNSATEAIRAEKLVKAFGSVTALAGVSLTVAWGETLGILGDNGAGKSTLIKILTGYHQPDSGQLFAEGKPVQLSFKRRSHPPGVEEGAQRYERERGVIHGVPAAVVVRFTSSGRPQWERTNPTAARSRKGGRSSPTRSCVAARY